MFWQWVTDRVEDTGKTEQEFLASVKVPGYTGRKARNAVKNLQVDQWQAARRKWFYGPVMWFSYRMIEVAYLDAKDQGPIPSDDTLLARDWIATSESFLADRLHGKT